MSNCNPFKISLKSLYSYDDLTDLPSINGVEVRGDLSLEDLGLDTWLTENTKDFITQNDLESIGFVTETELDNKGFVTGTELNSKGFVTESSLENYLSDFIVTDANGEVNTNGFTIDNSREFEERKIDVSAYSANIVYRQDDGIQYSEIMSYFNPYGFSTSSSINGYGTNASIYSDGRLELGDSYIGSVILDAYTLQALISLLG